MGSGQVQNIQLFEIQQYCKRELPRVYDDLARKRLRELETLGLRSSPRSLMNNIYVEIENNIKKGTFWGFALIGKMVAELAVNIVTAGFAEPMKKTASFGTKLLYNAVTTEINFRGILDSAKSFNKIGINRETADLVLSIGSLVPLLSLYTSTLSNAMLFVDAGNSRTQEIKLLNDLKKNISKLDKLLYRYELKIQSYETKMRAIEFTSGCIISSATKAPSLIVR
jgi:hypothetical protein